MHHRKNRRQLGRSGEHRQAMFRNMTNSLIRFEMIKTSVQKAKELRRIIEPMITLAKVDTISNRRLMFARVRNNKSVSKLFNEIGPRFLNCSGGYTRIIKCGYRVGDNAPMAYIGLVDRFK